MPNHRFRPVALVATVVLIALSLSIVALIAFAAPNKNVGPDQGRVDAELQRIQRPLVLSAVAPASNVEIAPTPIVVMPLPAMPAAPVAPSVPTTATQAPRAVLVPILMYHHVGDVNTIQTYNVNEAMFKWQVDYLAQNGYTTVSLDQIVAALNGAASLPPKPIAITFDDGWASQITNTAPVLLQHHFKATYYIIVNPTGKRRASMTWEELKQLRDEGMWIGSHTLSHGNLTRMSNPKLRNELTLSRQTLEQQLGMPVTSLAYPGGAFNSRVEQMAREAGYTSAVTVIKGYTQRSDRPYRLERVGVYGVDTQERFIAKVDETFFKKHWPFPTGQAKLTKDVFQEMDSDAPAPEP